MLIKKIINPSARCVSTPENVYGMFSNADLEFKDAVDKDGKTSFNTRYIY